MRTFGHKKRKSYCIYEAGAAELRRNGTRATRKKRIFTEISRGKSSEVHAISKLTRCW